MPRTHTLLSIIVTAALISASVVTGSMAIADDAAPEAVVTAVVEVGEPAVVEPAPVEPTVEPTAEPTVEPTIEPTIEPIAEPTAEPTIEPIAEPTAEPTVEPTVEPSATPVRPKDARTLKRAAAAAPVVDPSVVLEVQNWVRNGNYVENPPRFPEFAQASDDTVPYDAAGCPALEFPLGSDSFYTQSPCVAFGFPESPLATIPPTGAFTASAPHDDQFEQFLDVRNSTQATDARVNDVYVYSTLPRVGEAEFAVHLTGPIAPAGASGVTNAGNVIIEYTTAQNPCTTQIADLQNGCTDTWTSTFPTADPRPVTAYRIRFAANMTMAIGGRMLFRVPLVVDYAATAGADQVAWTSVTVTAQNADAPAGYVTPVESARAGIRVAERLSIGNRVWRDADNSGTINAVDDANPGIAGVTVGLFADFDGNGVADSAAIATDTTDTKGYYLFDDIVADANPNNNRYLVQIAANNFAAGGPLEGLRSSAPAISSADGDDNGIGNAGGTTTSGTIALANGSLRTGETDASGAPGDGAASRGNRGQADTASDLSIDFGFFGGADSSLSIGNRVWFDDGADGGGGVNAVQRNNGLHDSSERGVNGVRVDLYRDGNANGLADAGEYVAFDITSAGTPGSGRPGADLAGYYLFDGLDRGDYIVVIRAAEFASGKPLAGWHSSSFNGTRTAGAAGAVGTPATDLDDTGIEPANRRPDLAGVRSATITLSASNSTTGETDLSLESDPDGNPATPNEGSSPTEWDGPQSIGRESATDAGSNVAVDFGFIPPMSIGNRIWLDDSADPGQWTPGGSRNNGLIDATDDGNLASAGIQNPGIANVDIQLYNDANNNSSIDGGDTLVDVVTTNATGYYLFDGLAPGNYLVRVPSTEFGAGQPLADLASSFDAVAQVNPTNQTDSNDNGIDNAAPTANGIVSSPIQLTYLSEASSETDLAQSGTSTSIPGPQSRGRNGEANEDSDLTVDFGFVRPPLSIGNQVWLDDHVTNQSLRNNGVFDAGETAIAGVEIALFRDLNANGVADAGDDTGMRDTTDDSGFFLFANLPVGNYIVAVTADNFAAGGPLSGAISSRSVAPNPGAADNGADNNDNGIDAFVAGRGVISSRISLAYGQEPTTEGSASVNDPADGVGGRGGYGTRTADSDLTIDFGFFVPQSIGNRVWLDDSSNPANSATRNNAVLDASTDDLDNPNIAGVQGLGVAGAVMRLYRDLDSDGLIDAGEDSGRTTTTNASGYYLFDGIPRGRYVVGVEASNFAAGGPLAGFRSSYRTTPATDNDTDNTDDGVGTVPDATYGVISPSIALSRLSATSGLEPLASTETDPTPQTQLNRGLNGELDSMSNLTVDFGFTRVPMSLGNQVWLDEHPTSPTLRNNGIFDAGETPFAGVSVDLYHDANADSAPDGALIATATTDGSGYYLFSNLAPGGYLVAVSAANFETDGPLEGLISSRTPSTADNQVDNDDNGRDASTTFGVISSRIVLTPGAEPAGESPANGRGSHGELDADSDLTIDFGFYTPFRLGDTVWIDDTVSPVSWADRNDGTHDASESAAAGVTLRLYRDLDADGVIDAGEDSGRTTSTDALGHYVFADLARGNYIVSVESSNFAPGATLAGYSSSYTASVPTDDDLNDVDHGIGVTPSPTVGILSPSVVLDADTLSLDFGFARPALSLGNQVWFDYTAGDEEHSYNGILDGAESGIAGVEVGLHRDLDADGSIDAGEGTGLTATTDANGFYLFDNLPAGDYLVSIAASNFAAGEPLHNRMSSPVDATANATDGDDDGIATDSDVVSRTVTIAIGGSPSGETPTDGRGSHGEADTDSNLTIDFGFVPASVSVGDTVWVDLDENGTKDTAEAGIAGVELTLTDSEGDPVIDVFGAAVTAVTTDADGAYLFAGLPVLPAAASYTVTIDSDSPALVGFTALVAGDSLTSGALPSSGDADLDLDFAFVPLVGVGDRVWIDSNRHGVQSALDVGRSGVVVTLLTAAGVPAVDAFGDPVAPATSDADGRYSFADLRPGDYRVEFAPIGGHDFTLTGAGTSSTDSDANRTTGMTPVFTIAPIASGDTRAAVTDDGLGDAKFINATIDAGYRLVQYDISVVKQFAAANTTSRQITWDFTVANSGPDASSAAVVVTDELPSNLTYVSGGSAEFVCTTVDRTVTCEHPGGLAPGVSLSFSIVTSYKGYPTTLSNSATVAGGAADTAVSNNASSANVPTGILPRKPKPPAAPTTPTTPGDSGTVDAAPTRAPTVEPSPTPTPSATVSPSPEPVPSPTASAAPDDSVASFAVPWWWWIAAAILALLIIGGIVIAMGRRR